MKLLVIAVVLIATLSANAQDAKCRAALKKYHEEFNADYDAAAAAAAKSKHLLGDDPAAGVAAIERLTAQRLSLETLEMRIGQMNICSLDVDPLSSTYSEYTNQAYRYSRVEVRKLRDIVTKHHLDEELR